MSDKEMHTRVGIIDPKDNTALMDAIMHLVLYANSGGVRSPGDNVTVMLPYGIEVGSDPDHMEDIGEWEINIKKVS